MTLENGDEVVIDYRGEGDTFGFLSMVGKDRVRSNIVAVEDTICYLLGQEMLMKLLDSHLVFTEYFLKSHITKYIDRTYREMQDKSMFYGGSDRLLFTTRVGDMAIKDVVSARGRHVHPGSGADHDREPHQFHHHRRQERSSCRAS